MYVYIYVYVCMCIYIYTYILCLYYYYIIWRGRFFFGEQHRGGEIASRGYGMERVNFG